MYEQITRNKRLSVVYTIVFFVFWAAMGALAGLLIMLFTGRPERSAAATVDAAATGSAAIGGGVVAAVLALGAVAFVLTTGPRAVLALSGARPAEAKRDAQVINLVEALALGSGLPAPTVHIIDDPAPNAFATGTSPKNAAVTVTTGLLALLNREELEGVLAHEISHIRNFDVRLILIVTTLIGLAGMVSTIAFRSAFFARGGRNQQQMAIVIIVIGALTGLFAVLLGPLVKMALSRNRESLADVSAVDLTRNPSGLMRALQKLEANAVPMARSNSAVNAMCINDPQGRVPEQRRSWLSRLYDSHPPMAERIRVLERLQLGQ